MKINAYGMDNGYNRNSRKTKIIFLITFGMVLLFSFAFSTYSFLVLVEGEKVCIGQTCIEEVAGSEWVDHFCRPRDDGNIWCDVNYQGQLMTIPINLVNMTSVRGCIKYDCSVKIYAWKNKKIMEE